MPSAAFTKFALRILEVKRLLSLCAPDDADYRIKKENVARDEALLRGAHVLLCSHLEGYFEDLISDLIEAYDKLTTQVTLLPEELRACQVMGASKWEIKDPNKRWEAVQAWASHPLVHVGVAKPPGCMEPGLHIDGFSSPGTNEIEGLFKTVGINNVWELFKAIEADQILSQSVNTIVHRRNQIAHCKADATITLADAKIYVERAERIAEVFEQVVTVDINARLTLADCWQELENAVQ
jgi:hypothetical protein